MLPGVFLVVLSVNLFSQPDNRTFLPGLSEFQVIDHYLELADRQSVEQQWVEYARFGLNTVLADWERLMLMRQGDDFDISDYRPQAEAAFNDIITERHARWISSSFFSAASPSELGALSSEIETLNMRYLYETGDDGSLRYKDASGYHDVYSYDDESSPVLREKGEKRLWRESLQSTITSLMSEWAEKMTTAFSELRTSISDIRLRKMLDTAYDSDFVSFSESYRNELNRLFQMEQSRFSGRRLYDQYSLQRRTEDDTAESVAEKLIQRTGTELGAKLETPYKWNGLPYGSC